MGEPVIPVLQRRVDGVTGGCADVDCTDHRSNITGLLLAYAWQLVQHVHVIGEDHAWIVIALN